MQNCKNELQHTTIRDSLILPMFETFEEPLILTGPHKKTTFTTVMKIFEVKLDSREAFGLFVLRRLLHIVQEIAEISSMVTWLSYFAYASTQHEACRFSYLLSLCHDLLCSLKSDLLYENKFNFQYCLYYFDRQPVDLVGHRCYCLSLKCVGLVLSNHSDSDFPILSVFTSKQPTTRDYWWPIQ